MLNEKLKIAVVGIGRQSSKYLKILPECDNLILDSVVDIDAKALQPYEGLKKEIGLFSTVDELIQQRKPDIALICLPHFDHAEAIEKLMRGGIDVIKEKPFAMNLKEAANYEALQLETGKRVFTTVKRRYDPVYASYPNLFKDRLGDVFQFSANYTKNIDDLGSGWRASFEKAGGGALVDMGYHFIDVLK